MPKFYKLTSYDDCEDVFGTPDFLAFLIFISANDRKFIPSSNNISSTFCDGDVDDWRLVWSDNSRKLNIWGVYQDDISHRRILQYQNPTTKDTQRDSGFQFDSYACFLVRNNIIYIINLFHNS